MAKKNNKQKKYKTLLSVLANGSTDEARALLIKNSGEDANNTQDLEQKLARMYANSTSKIDIEKQFAQIHPHKDFILKYVQPIVELPKINPIENEQKTSEQEIVKNVVVHDGYSNCEGNPNCTCNKTSSACGCSGFSGFNGANSYSNATGEIATNNNQTTLVLGLVSVVAIFGMVLYFKQK